MKRFILVILSLTTIIFTGAATSQTTSSGNEKIDSKTKVASEVKVVNEMVEPTKVTTDLIPNGNTTRQSTDKYEGIEITVNINTATLEELSALLIGIGSKKAQLIIDYREKHGPFSSNEALMEVKGIGPSTIQKNANRIIL